MISGKSGPSKHLDFLDGLRAIAALWVVMHHAQATALHSSGNWVMDRIAVALHHGRLSVDLFIVLSGFCLMFRVIKDGDEFRGGVMNFIKRRAWRILPAYYAAIGFSLLLTWLFIHDNTGRIWDVTQPVTWGNLFTHLFMVHDVFGDDFKINYVLWSIAVEWRIYFLFPVLVLAWRNFGPIKTCLAAIVISWPLAELLQYLLHASLTINYLGLFAGGMLAAGIAFSKSASLQLLQKLPWGIIGVIAFVAAYWGGQGDPEQMIPRDYAAGLASMSFLVLASLNKDSWYCKAVGCKPLAFVGSFAYSIYLIHAPILQILWQYPFARLQSNQPVMLSILIFVGMPIIVGISYVFYRLFEKPFMRDRSQKIKGSGFDLPEEKLSKA